ncbi:MAG: septum formation protein Maf, partial [Cycloclasticus sp.]|nr:septum formation protein Maf [Cycloclasticus sp.]MBQ0790431.1 septum formation protein Maf [Cycloclasticus sp.]
RDNETPVDLALRLAVEKAKALKVQYPNHLIIGSDQVAMLGETQLTKPGSHDNCVKQLQLSSGKTLAFYTAVCVFNSMTGDYKVDVDSCKVQMKHLTNEQIERYVEKDKPYGCAAAFKSEGLGIALFEKIEGDDPNALVGLPLIKLIKLLNQMGFSVL